MHYTGTLYRNPYVPASPLLEVTQGCSHNKCKFCTMYKNVPFRMSPPEWVEDDLKEIARDFPDTPRLQLVGADPFCMDFEHLNNLCDMIHMYLPKVRTITMAARVTNVANKTVKELRTLCDKGMNEIFLGNESADDWTLDRIHKGYHAADTLEQCGKLDEAGIRYWLTFLNGVAGRSHSREHAVNTAKIFSRCHPLVVGTGGLTLFPGTPLLHEAEKGEFDPLSEREMLEELLIFVENLDCDCTFITHHTISTNLSGRDFLGNKERIINSLKREIESGDMERYAAMRDSKRTL